MHSDTLKGKKIYSILTMIWCKRDQSHWCACAHFDHFIEFMSSNENNELPILRTDQIHMYVEFDRYKTYLQMCVRCTHSLTRCVMLQRWYSLFFTFNFFFIRSISVCLRIMTFHRMIYDLISSVEIDEEK